MGKITVHSFMFFVLIILVNVIQESHQGVIKDDKEAFSQYSLNALLKAKKDRPIELKDVKLETCPRGGECEKRNGKKPDSNYDSDSDELHQTGTNQGSRRNKKDQMSVAKKSYLKGENLFALQSNNGNGKNSGTQAYAKNNYLYASGNYGKGKKPNTSKHDDSSAESDSDESDYSSESDESDYDISESESHEKETNLPEPSKPKGSKQKEQMVHHSDESESSDSDSESSEESDASSSESDSSSSDDSESQSSYSDSSSSEESYSSESDSSESYSSESDSSESYSSESYSSESDSSESDSDSSSPEKSDCSESKLHRPAKTNKPPKLHKPAASNKPPKSNKPAKPNKPAKSTYNPVPKPSNPKYTDSRENDYLVVYDDSEESEEESLHNALSHNIVIHINPHNKICKE